MSRPISGCWKIPKSPANSLLTTLNFITNHPFGLLLTILIFNPNEARGSVLIKGQRHQDPPSETKR